MEDESRGNDLLKGGKRDDDKNLLGESSFLPISPLRTSYFDRYMIYPLSSPAPFRAFATAEKQGKFTSVWLISFTDLIALMLAFFVLTFSMSEIDPTKWPELEGSLRGEFNKYQNPDDFEGGPETITLTRVRYARALNLDYISALLNTRLKENESLKEAGLFPQSDRLLLSLPNDLLFAAGQAKISEAGKEALEALLPALNRIDNAIEIAGHADPRSLSGTGEYISNWHLSLARARSVAAYLDDQGFKRELSIEGYSSARYAEIGEDVPEAERLSLSRRVDIVILPNQTKERKKLRVRLKDS